MTSVHTGLFFVDQLKQMGRTSSPAHSYIPYDNKVLLLVSAVLVRYCQFLAALCSA